MLLFPLQLLFLFAMSLFDVITIAVIVVLLAIHSVYVVDLSIGFTSL